MFNPFPNFPSFNRLPYNLYFKSLQNNKILDWSKFKAFADDNLKVNQILKFPLGW